MSIKEYFAKVQAISEKIIVEPLNDRMVDSVACFERTVLGTIKPNSVKDIQGIVALSNEYLIPLYPVSKGKKLGLRNCLASTRICYFEFRESE